MGLNCLVRDTHRSAGKGRSYRRIYSMIASLACGGVSARQSIRARWFDAASNQRETLIILVSPPTQIDPSSPFLLIYHICRPLCTSCMRDPYYLHAVTIRFVSRQLDEPWITPSSRARPSSHSPGLPHTERCVTIMLYPMSSAPDLLTRSTPPTST